jgi:arginine N-succinyltransferase
VAPQRFSERFFAAMAGPVDADGRSPFWDALGRKFFRMDFDEAERLIEGARNRTLIVELMPPYPVYLPLLPQAAQQALGGVHAEGRLAYRILADEGFEAGAYVDIFDGGCVLQAHRRALRSFAHGQRRRAVAHAGEAAPVLCLVATIRERGFRAVVARCGLRALSESVALAPEAMRRLDVVAGDPVLCVRLR